MKRLLTLLVFAAACSKEPKTETFEIHEPSARPETTAKAPLAPPAASTFRTRLAAQNKTFSDWVALHDAIKQRLATETDRAQKAELELYRQQALKHALELCEPEGPSCKAFVKLHEELVVYSEPGGEYLPVSEIAFEGASAYLDTPSGDAIAWEAATTRLPGECEGYFGCALDWTNRTSGRYLELFPKGAHAADALKHYAELEPPTKAEEVADYDGESWQEVDDGLKNATRIVSACDPTQRQAAEAMLARAREGTAKLK